MYGLVNDVARYPEFLPWCTGARSEILSDSEVLASVQISKGVLKGEFATRNTLTQGAGILMQLVDGPFRRMTGEWRFEAIGERGSEVTFRVDFEFKNRLMAAAFNSAFESVCSSIVGAFAERARTIFARGAPSP